MSFADPQSVTFAAPLPVGAISLPRVNAAVNNASIYQSADRLTKLTASSQYGTKTRQLLRLDYTKVSADVYQPTINVSKSAAVYLVVESPKVGFSNAELLELYRGLKGAMTASTDTLISKLLGGES